LGVMEFDMPATPNKIWNAIQKVKLNLWPGF
jgi:hypothetical protein